MFRGTLIVRIAVIVFGLMILGGAWLVSIDTSGNDRPGPSDDRPASSNPVNPEQVHGRPPGE